MSTKTRYSAPRTYITVDLDEFDEDTIVDYLRDLGYYVGEVSHTGADPDEALVIQEEDVGRIATLLLCGQKRHAVEYLLEIVGRHIGRSLL